MGVEREELGELSDLDAVCRVVDVAGLNLVDIGCGPGAVSRELAALGATVLGIEPDPIQAEKNRAADPVAGLTLMEGRAEALPCDSGSIDGVFFFRSLHHVPIEHMDAALAEAARVLKPETGFLCIVEPGTTGTNFKITRPFHDETVVRAEAQAALRRMEGKLFRQQAHYGFAQYRRHESFEAMVDRFMALTYNDIDRERVETEEVRSLFEQGRTPQGDYCFDQPMLLDIYRAAAVHQPALAGGD